MDQRPSDEAVAALGRLAEVISDAEGRKSLVADMAGAMGEHYQNLPEGMRQAFGMFNEDQLRIVARLNERLIRDGFSVELPGGFGRVCFF
jgi:hypothetical protein